MSTPIVAEFSHNNSAAVVAEAIAQVWGFEALAWSDKKTARIAGTILGRIIERAEYVRLCSEGEHVIFRVVFPGGWNELTEGLK